jgi:uncharacterized membrane protein
MRAVLFATVALTMLAAARATDRFEDIPGPPNSSFSRVSGISGDGRFVWGSSDNNGVSQGRIFSNGTYTWIPLLTPDKSTQIGRLSYDGSVWAGSGEVSGFNSHMVRFANGVLTDLHTGAVFGPGGQLDGYTQSAASAVSANVTRSYAGKGVVRHVW